MENELRGKEALSASACRTACKPDFANPSASRSANLSVPSKRILSSMHNGRQGTWGLRALHPGGTVCKVPERVGARSGLHAPRPNPPSGGGGLKTHGISVQTLVLRFTGHCFRPPRLHQQGGTVVQRQNNYMTDYTAGASIANGADVRDLRPVTKASSAL